ncbi:hypothetical protein TSUD_269150 [Trifolium subterraneum]|uniref:C2H2-type domain-containing protein n=1 Tax=Trifolium subterraneum TaxID=3900 RepID=A0A2Z6MXW5_TRISU|nr:hypothetical protein TSUD_269150 [Trifolium subterraneum]
MMTKVEFLCSECGKYFPSPEALAVHTIEQHYPNRILESSKQPKPQQNAPPPPPPPLPENAPPPLENAPPPLVLPLHLNQPAYARDFDLNLPFMSNE